MSNRDAPTVTFKKLTIGIEAAGIRVSLEGFVPLALVPDQAREFQPEARRLCLERIAAEFPALLSQNSLFHTESAT